LRSIASQDLLPDELVVCDDRSSDATAQIVEQFVREAAFRVRLEVNPQRLGIARSFAKAISLCRGGLVVLADQDDIWLPNKLRRLVGALEENPAAGFAFSDAEMVDEEGRSLGLRLWEALRFSTACQKRCAEGDTFRVLLKRNVVTGATMAFRNQWRDLLLPVPDSWMHDGWIALLLSTVSGCVPIAEPLIKYRQHPAQHQGEKELTLLRQLMIARQQGRDYFRVSTQKYVDVLDRLAEHADRLADSMVFADLQAKVEHFRTRLWMRDGPARLSLVARELLAGRYQRYSLGWKSLAQDLFL
jgi:glycosyltransferase involved in cell wall biosynthesis